MAAVAQRQQMIALLNVCDFNLDRHLQFLIDTQGLSSFANIRLLELCDFDQIASDALKFWVDDQINQGTAVNLVDYTSFNAATRDEYILLANSARQAEVGVDDVTFSSQVQTISMG